MSKPRILIGMEGGRVTQIASNTDIEYVVVNYDPIDIDEDDNPIEGIYSQNILFKTGEAYKLLDNSKYPLSDSEKMVKNFLKESNF